MANRATTIEQQKQKLKIRGVIISDEKYADEILKNVGYYHLGFYLFPFEKTYPLLDKRRKHDVIDDTRLEDAIALHRFDCDLRSILLKYTSQIELAFRTALIYHLSTKYETKPCWFLDKTIVKDEVIDEIKAGYANLRKNGAIKNHHVNHRRSKYAPAWKTLEFETLGVIQKIYEGIHRADDKLPVNRQFNIPNTSVFINYIDAIRQLRNACAHGNIIYDIRLSKSIIPGPAGNFIGSKRQRLAGLLGITRYMLKQISQDSADEMWKELGSCFMNLFIKQPKLKRIVEDTTKVNIADFS